MKIPASVIAEDHRLDGATERSSLDLARFRWEQTLDPTGPRHSFSAYGRAVGRSHKTISAWAKGYAIHLDAGHPVLDAFRLAYLSAEDQQFAEAIAEGSGEPVARIARGDNRRRREVTALARERAARRGTDPVEEARDIAARQRQTREMEHRHREEARQRTSLRFISIEGHLATAKRRLTQALSEAEGVGFSEEELALVRSTIANVRAILDLLDLRMAGAPDIDWDAEMAKLTGGAS